jgi:hypothetical protein
MSEKAMSREQTMADKENLVEKYKTALKKVQLVNEIKNGLGEEIKKNPRPKIIKKSLSSKIITIIKYSLNFNMNFDKLIETVSEILENEKIEKKGLILTYNLNPKVHLAMNLELQYKTQGMNTEFKPVDEFEVEIGGIVINFVKEPLLE